jgi:hypothetical protein
MRERCSLLTLSVGMPSVVASRRRNQERQWKRKAGLFLPLIPLASRGRHRQVELLVCSLPTPRDLAAPALPRRLYRRNGLRRLDRGRGAARTRLRVRWHQRARERGVGALRPGVLCAARRDDGARHHRVQVATLSPQSGFVFGVNGKPAPRDVDRAVKQLLGTRV